MAEGDPDRAAALRAEVERLARELDGALATLDNLGGVAEWKLRSRLLRLEAEYLLANAPNQPKAGLRSRIEDFLARWIGILAPIATPVAVVLIGTHLTATYQEILELRKIEMAEQRLDFDTIQALDGHFETLRSEDIGLNEAGAVAARIARFGPRAIAPLVAELAYVRNKDSPRGQALRRALELMALDAVQRAQLCRILSAAIVKGETGPVGQVGLAIAKEVAATADCTT